MNQSTTKVRTALNIQISEREVGIEIYDADGKLVRNDRYEGVRTESTYSVATFEERAIPYSKYEPASQLDPTFMREMNENTVIHAIKRILEAAFNMDLDVANIMQQVKIPK